MIKTIKHRFSLMHPMAFVLLKVVLNLILLSSCVLYIYADSSTCVEKAFLLYYHREIVKRYLSSLVLAFGGSFLLDYVSSAAVK